MATPPPSPSWHPAPTAPRLVPGEVHVWRASLLPGGERVDALRELLSAEERARAARFRFQLHQRRYVVGRAVQRRLLARYLGVPPGEIAYRLGMHGKPALDPALHDPALRFNVSNSEDGLLVAVGLAKVGIDLEAQRPVTERDAIAGRFFSAPEQEVFHSLPEAERDAAFYTCWTRKEAWLKALGNGLTMPLDCFDVTLRPGSPARLLATRGDSDAAARWTLREVEVGPGWFAALAVEGPLEALELYHWGMEPFPNGS